MEGADREHKIRHEQQRESEREIVVANLQSKYLCTRQK